MKAEFYFPKKIQNDICILGWIADAAGNRIPGIRNRRTIMRAHYAIATVATVLIVFGLKLIFFSAPPAEADAVESVRIDVSQMQQNIKNIPEQKMHDMTFVFSEGD